MTLCVRMLVTIRLSVVYVCVCMCVCMCLCVCMCVRDFALLNLGVCLLNTHQI